ncbi:MAG: hypothetical protein NWE96_06745 [Candidatus Bathyarchaeota archaeon]|nr:hypothetical protein [Candidatus Bathyarchaeota archaeon]
MSHRLREGKTADIIFGVTIPTIVALLIVVVSTQSSVAIIGLKYALLEAIVVVGVPMLIGLIWNQWAGGASGFLLGSLYALFYADQLYASQGSADMSLLGNLVSAMLIGYIAGALGKRSLNVRRLIMAGVTAGVMGSLIVIYSSLYSPILGITLSGVALAFLSRILAGVIVPFIARAFLRHGAAKKQLELS